MALMTYIALLGLRDPNLRASVNRFIEGAAAKLSQMMQVLPLEQLRADIAASLEEGERMPPDEQLEAMRTMKMGRDFTITASNEWFLQSIVTAIDAVAPLFAARKWRLLKSATSEFLTGGRSQWRCIGQTLLSRTSSFLPPSVCPALMSCFRCRGISQCSGVLRVKALAMPNLSRETRLRVLTPGS